MSYKPNQRTIPNKEFKTMSHLYKKKRNSNKKHTGSISREGKDIPFVRIQNRDSSNESKKVLIVVTDSKQWTIECLPYSENTVADIQERGLRTLQENLLTVSGRRNRFFQACKLLKAQYVFQHAHSYIIDSVLTHYSRLLGKHYPYRVKKTISQQETPISVEFSSEYYYAFCGTTHSVLEASSNVMAPKFGGSMGTFPHLQEPPGFSRIPPGNKSLTLDTLDNLDSVEEIIYPLPKPDMQPGEPTPERGVTMDTIFPEHLTEIALQIAYNQLCGDTAKHLQAILNATPMDKDLIEDIEAEVDEIREEYVAKYPNMDAGRRQMYIDGEAQAKYDLQKAGMTAERIQQAFQPDFDLGEEEVATSIINDFWDALK